MLQVFKMSIGKQGKLEAHAQVKVNQEFSKCNILQRGEERNCGRLTRMCLEGPLL